MSSDDRAVGHKVLGHQLPSVEISLKTKNENQFLHDTCCHMVEIFLYIQHICNTEIAISTARINALLTKFCRIKPQAVFTQRD